MPPAVSQQESPDTVNFAVLGDDRRTLAVVSAIARHPGCRLTTVAATGPLTAEILTITADARVVEAAADLLTLPPRTVLILASADPEHLQIAKRLADDEHPLFLLPDRGHADGFAYELLLVRDEKPVLLFASTALLLASWVCCELNESGLRLPDETLVNSDRVDNSTERSDGVNLRHLHLERESLPKVDVRTHARTTEVHEDDIEAAFLHDAPLLLRLAGGFTRVTAVYARAGEAGIVNATVTLAGEQQPDTLWSFRPSTEMHWRLHLRGEQTAVEGGTRVTAADDSPENTSTSVSDWQRVIEASMLGDPVLVSAETAERELQAFLNLLTTPTSARGRESWNRLIATFEILDAIRRSLRRRRTIELHHEETSERGQFKTQMTAIGCGVLLLTLLAVIGLMLLGAALDTRSVVERQAEAAEAVFRIEDFQGNTAALTASAAERAQRVLMAADSEPFPILIEQFDDGPIDAARQAELSQQLRQLAPRAEAPRVAVEVLAPAWVTTVMRVGRILVFVPLFVFLALQLLVFLARPAG